MKRRKTRKTICLAVTITVPHWATVTQAKAAVRDYLNSSNNWDLDGPDYQEGKLRAKKVVAMRRA